MIYVGIIIGLILIAILWEVYRETHGFVLTRYNVEVPWESMDRPVKVIFLSDLHNQLYGEKNRLLVDEIKKQKPDYIFITGDMLVGKEGHDWTIAKELVEQLPEIAPVYYANGNHEQRMHLEPEKYGEEYEAYKGLLEQAGVHFLINESVELLWNENKVRIYGAELPRECYGRFGHYWLKEEDMTTRLGEAEKDTYNILLAHHPEFAKCYFAWGADLVLSGHLHGGIMRIPGIGGVISPQLGLFPRYSGEQTKEDGKEIIVSKGLGTHTFPIRFLNPAELIILEFQGNEACYKEQDLV